jgi:hypothetical protein
LTRHRRLARQLVDRIDVQVLLTGGARRQQQPFAVRADVLACDVDAGRQRAGAPADVVEHDLYGLGAACGCAG